MWHKCHPWRAKGHPPTDSQCAAGNSKSSPGGRGMDHFPGNYANWALSLPGKHRSIETAAYAANASSTKGAALDSMYETAQRQCGRAGPVWKWSLKRIDIIRVEYLYEFCRAQFLFTGARWTECNSLPTIAHRPRGRAVPRPARWMGHPPTMGCAARWIAAATHERKLSAQWHASRRQFGVRRREEEEAERKRRGGGRVPVWRAHRWIRQMFGSIVMNGAMVVPRQRPAMNGQSAADRINFRRASRTWDLPSLGTL